MADGGRSAHGDYERGSLSPVPPMSSSKRKFEDPVETGRRSGLSDGGQRPSYKSVPPPLSDFELAKQRAEQIAARLVGTELKRARTSADDSDGVVGSNVEQGHSHGYGHVDERPAPDYYSQQPPLQTRKVDVPNSKVGLVIGKGGETIRTLQQQSGAKIQVTRDAETDPNSTTRQVELTGTPEQISRAEQLIRDVVGDQGAPTGGPTVGSVPGVGEQMQIRVPNNKVGLIIGKGGETIRNLQNSSGCRIQVQHDRETEPGAMERVVTLLGTKQQTEMATEMIKDVIGEGRSRGPSAHGYQQGFRPGPPQPWGPPPSMQQPGYGYQQGYAGAPQQYGGYSGWDQPPPVPGQQPAQQGSYDYYQQNQTSEGSQQNNTDGNFNYGQQGYYGGYDQQGYGQESQAYDQQAYGQQQGYDQAYNQQEQDYSGGYGYEYDQSYSYDQSAQYPQAEGAPPSEYDYPQPPASSAAQTAQS